MSHYVTLGNVSDSIYFTIGLNYKLDPEINTRSFSSSVDKELADQMLTIGNHKLCYTSGFGDYLGCQRKEANLVYFDIRLEKNGKEFRSGVNYQPESSFFRIDSVEYVNFRDKVSTGSFSYIISGEFQTTLYEFENRLVKDSVEVNGTYKVGIWDARGI